MHKHFVVHTIIYSYWNVWFMCPLAQFNQKYCLEYVYTRYTFPRIRPCCRSKWSQTTHHQSVLLCSREHGEKPCCEEWELEINSVCWHKHLALYLWHVWVHVYVYACLFDCVSIWHQICDILTHKIHFEFKIYTTHEQNLKNYAE